MMDVLQGMSLIKNIMSILTTSSSAQSADLRRIVQDELRNSTTSEQSEMLQKIAHMIDQRNATELQEASQQRDYYKKEVKELTQQLQSASTQKKASENREKLQKLLDLLVDVNDAKRNDTRETENLGGRRRPQKKKDVPKMPDGFLPWCDQPKGGMMQPVSNQQHCGPEHQLEYDERSFRDGQRPCVRGPQRGSKDYHRSTSQGRSYASYNEGKPWQGRGGSHASYNEGKPWQGRGGSAASYNEGKPWQEGGPHASYNEGKPWQGEGGPHASYNEGKPWQGEGGPHASYNEGKPWQEGGGSYASYNEGKPWEGFFNNHQFRPQSTQGNTIDNQQMKQLSGEAFKFNRGRPFSERGIFKNPNFRGQGRGRGNFIPNSHSRNDTRKTENFRGGARPQKNSAKSKQNSTAEFSTKDEDDVSQLCAQMRNMSTSNSELQLTPEEITTIKNILKRDQGKKTQEAKSKKNRNKKKAEAATDMSKQNPESKSEDDDFPPKECTEKEEKPAQGAKVKKPQKEKKVPVQSNSTPSSETPASQSKPAPKEVLQFFPVTGFDESLLQMLTDSNRLKDVMLFAKEGEKVISCQPSTVKELRDFKTRYPTSELVVIKSVPNP